MNKNNSIENISIEYNSIKNNSLETVNKTFCQEIDQRKSCSEKLKNTLQNMF